ncbi:MAG: WecB/TagA/CpsF family glycosyltransferase [Clostridia bacterium]|nr:WecB/TagA/CpsF family glycosyltransferase [Clostridia bacterium]
MSEKINIRGVYFDNVNMDEAMQTVKSMIDTDVFSYMFTPNSEIVQSCIENPELYEVINSASLVIPDGIGVVYASKILKTPLKEKVPGCEVAEKIMQYAAKTGDGVFFFGGGKKCEERDAVSVIAAEKMKEKYPGLNVVGTRDGYFTNDDVPSIIDEINASGAKILFVCLGAPKQEKWIYENRDALKVNFAAGLGGTLDVFAGIAKRAPEFFLKTNLEWFYRLLCMPTRLGRMMKLPKFLFGTIINKNKGFDNK